MNDSQLSLLALQRLVLALEVAIDALAFADVPDDRSLSRARALKWGAEDLELSTVALLLEGGASWETLAEQVGITKQSLHRRLSHRVSDTVAQWIKEPPQDRNVLVRRWSTAMDALRLAVTEFDSATPQSHASRVSRAVRNARRSGLPS